MKTMTGRAVPAAAAAALAASCLCLGGAALAPQAEARSAVGTPHVRSFTAANWKVIVKCSKVAGADGYQFDVAPVRAKRVRAAQAGRKFVRDLWWSPLDRPTRAGTIDGEPVYDTAHFPVRAKVRAFRTVDGKRHYGKWSKKATIYDWENETPESYIARDAKNYLRYPGSYEAAKKSFRQYKAKYPYLFPKAHSWKLYGLA